MLVYKTKIFRFFIYKECFDLTWVHLYLSIFYKSLHSPLSVGKSSCLEVNHNILPNTPHLHNTHLTPNPPSIPTTYHVPHPLPNPHHKIHRPHPRSSRPNHNLPLLHDSPLRNPQSPSHLQPHQPTNIPTIQRPSNRPTRLGYKHRYYPPHSRLRRENMSETCFFIYLPRSIRYCRNLPTLFHGHSPRRSINPLHPRCLESSLFSIN